MEAIIQSSQEHHNMTEDSSDRSDESSTMSQEYKSRGFEDYDIAKRLKVSTGERCTMRNELQNNARNKDFHLSIESNIDSNEQPQNNAHQLEDVHRQEMSLNLGKSKKYDFPNVHLGDVLNYHTERIDDTESRTDSSQICRSKDPTMKNALFNLQSAQEKYLAANFERSPKEFNYLVEREIKEYGIAKGYNLTVDRMKEFNLPHERPRESLTNGIPSRERLNGIGILDSSDHRNLHGQTRTPQDLECIVYERMRRPQHHFLNRMDFAGQNLTTALHVRQTSVTQIQQSQQQQQQEQQIKSFTIDAILAHRNNHRERYQRNQQQLRKTTRVVRQECQEITGKNGHCTGKIPDTNVNEVSGVVNNGKAKRVRTIFTAEQLERLEGEFARQQYMVGPERLYLAHALRLTEAQVKVWFQNRRIKWRKVNHEQHCQAVSEHRQRCSLPGTLEIHEDESNETSNVNWCINSSIAASTSSDESSLINASNQLQRDICDSSIVKS